MKLQVLAILIIFLADGFVNSQTIGGITGLLNTPSAQMQEDGTFMMGFNYLPNIVTPEPFNYNTGSYYFNITFLPFLEVSYKMTLFSNDGKYNRQDRSIGLRGRLIKERHIIPSVVVGANDIHTHVEGSQNQYFGSMYVVATKGFSWNKNKLGLTMGYSFAPFRHNNYVGLLGGLSYSPYFFNQLNLMTEYDSNHINIGSSLLVLKHLHLLAFMCDFKKDIVGGISYKVFL